MAGIYRSSSSSSWSSSSEIPAPVPVPSGSAVGEMEYPALSFPGYAEKPLDEQLAPIAVVGMDIDITGCRLPGDVSSVSEFWDLMMSKGTGNMPKVPASRFNIDAHYHENNDRPGSFAVLGGYFLNGDLADFDPGLFGLTPIEAMWMDPQQRKLLEVVYETLESGGISMEKISGTCTAVFAASFTADWQQMAFKEPSFRHNLAATGVDPGIISNRISHVFNMNGPSVVCNTACSSSVYALHHACSALRNHEAEGAIVAGVNLIITVDQHMNTAKLGVLSPTSTCHTFDASADGYGRADAVGAVYLKRLSDAIRCGDPIRGVIRSSATNSNGKVPGAAIVQPNREGQASVISTAYQRGGNLDPRLTGYFECHGTGTAVGDPLEVEAISLTMNENRQPGENPLWIGAVKTNIGHSEAASGLSALIKAVMIVERGVIPATRGVVNPNPAIKWDEWKVNVPTDAVPFPRELPVRRVSINSFGYGGTNAHVIVEGTESIARCAPAYTYFNNWDARHRGLRTLRRVVERKRPFLLPFSAHDKATLRRNIDAHGKVASKYSLLDLSYTLSSRRSYLHSKAFTVANLDTLSNAFGKVNENFKFADKKSIRSVGFVFTGQGAQWARMGTQLMTYCPDFLRSIRALDLVLGELHDGPEWSIDDILHEHADVSPINEAEFSQPLCTAVQIATVQLLDSWGVRPAVTVGHSSGEMAAAYAAGLVSAEDAIIAAYYRGRVAKDIDTDGAMMAVGLGADAIQPYLAGVENQVVVACHNSPSLITLSGDTDAIEIVKTKLDAAKVFARPVKTNGKAYHSHHTAAVADKYEALVRAANEARGECGLRLVTTAKMVSSVTNEVLPEGSVLDETYWSANLRSPVLFNQAVQTVLTTDQLSDVDLLIEVGPHSAMAGPIKQIKAELKADRIDYVPTLLRATDCAVRVLKVAGELFLRSYPVNMDKITHAFVEESFTLPGHKPVRGATIVDLPPYQWNYTRPLWGEARASSEQRNLMFPRHDVLGQLVIGNSLAEPTWRNVLRVHDLPWLKDHHLGGEFVFPAAGYFAMAIEAIRQLNESSPTPVNVECYVLRDVSIKTALVTPDDDEGIEVTFNIRHSIFGHGWWDWSVSSLNGERVRKDHMSGSISMNTRQQRKTPWEIPQFPQRTSGKAWNLALREVGFDYGPTFQDMEDVRFDGKRYEASCTTNIKQMVDESLGESRYVLHPACIDSTLQLSIASIYAGRTNAMECGVVPMQVDEVAIWPPTEEQLQARRANVYSVADRRGIRTSVSSVQMTAADGQMIMEIVNMRATAYEAAVPPKTESALEDAPYGEITWELDLAVAENRDGLTTTELINLALFKHPGLETVELGFKNALEVLRRYPRALYTVVVTTEEEAVEAKGVVPGNHNARIVKVDASQELEKQGLKRDKYDVLIAPEDGELSSKLRALLKTGHAWNIHPEVTMVRATDSKAESIKHSVQLVYRTSQTSSITSEVQTALEGLGWDVTAITWNASGESSIAEHVIMLTDFEGPLLFNMKEEDFAALQTIIAQTSSLLWVSAGALLEGRKPEHAMASGLARVISAEQASIDFRTLDIDTDNVSRELIIKSILRVAQLQVAKDEDLHEREFCVSNGKTYISRLVRNHGLNDVYAKENKAQSKHFYPGSRIAGRLLKSKVALQEVQEASVDAVQPGHVEVQVQSSGLTKEGVLVISGSDYATTFSHEIGGVVKRIGSGVSSFKEGDRVVGFSVARFDSHQLVPATMLHKLEDEDDMTKAVSTLMAFASALYGLENLAAVKGGQTVLVLNNTGFAGVAAIKVAQLKGAIPYAVVRTDDEAIFLENRLALDASQVIKSSDGLVTERLEQLTNGHGADVVFSSSSVDAGASHEAWRHIAAFGCFLDSGRKNNLGRVVLDGIPVQRGARYMPFDILEINQSHPELLSSLLPIIFDLHKRGFSVAPGDLESFELGDLDRAIAAFSDHFGATKPVIRHQACKTPIDMLPAQVKLRFSPDVTYLFVGGLGGLGRSLASWMMESGARRFTFLSRSGADSKSAAKFVQDLKTAGAFVQVVRGDAALRTSVVRAVEGVPSQHPIKGVVHAAMVLRDGLFHSMTFDAWKQSTQAKVMGARNLHSVLANTPLDFFLMTSSVSGILGTPGQSNYAAANAYLDSLARHRRSVNAAATSVVLPMVLGVGVVAEHTELEEALKRKGMYGVDEEHLLQSLEAAMRSSSLQRVPDHVVVGLDPSKLQNAMADASADGGFWVEDSRFSHIVHDINSSANDTTAPGGQSILATIKAAGSLDEAVAAVNDHFKGKLARMLMLDADDVDAQSGSVASYGIDSMVGAELRNWIFKEYKMDVSFQQLLSETLTIDKFSRTAVTRGGWDRRASWGHDVVLSRRIEGRAGKGAAESLKANVKKNQIQIHQLSLSELLWLLASVAIKVHIAASKVVIRAQQLSHVSLAVAKVQRPHVTDALVRHLEQPGVQRLGHGKQLVQVQVHLGAAPAAEGVAELGRGNDPEAEDIEHGVPFQETQHVGQGGRVGDELVDGGRRGLLPDGDLRAGGKLEVRDEFAGDDGWEFAVSKRRARVADPLPPPDVAEDGRCDDGDEDDVAPPPVEGEHGADTSHDGGGAVDDGKDLDIAAAPLDKSGGHGATQGILGGGEVALGLGPYIRHPEGVDQAKQRNGPVAKVAGEDVAGHVDIRVGRVYGHVRAGADEHGAGAHEYVHEPAADGLAAQLADRHGQAHLDVEQSLATVAAARELGPLPTPLQAQEADVSVRHRRVVEGKASQDAGGGGADGHEDYGVDGQGCNVPHVGGEVTGVGELQQTHDPREVVDEARTLGEAERLGRRGPDELDAVGRWRCRCRAGPRGLLVLHGLDAAGVDGGRMGIVAGWRRCHLSAKGGGSARLPGAGGWQGWKGAGKGGGRRPGVVAGGRAWWWKAAGSGGGRRPGAVVEGGRERSAMYKQDRDGYGARMAGRVRKEPRPAAAGDGGEMLRKPSVGRVRLRSNHQLPSVCLY
ncbi:LOW QUALITY PROTEIN: Polyketide synthase [Tolypocladium capitatum]|uniref:Polyketide synthase n=1 Tax=Tolypocladium capitatum TaxID=45235 RepID=A0A2K3QAK6_9HYPO|nr:LOW QUALITY PROTEIN: Polyketide synthase [Tolypocladium capitatum]